jgi:arabinose-5-phosphate isomerase
LTSESNPSAGFAGRAADDALSGRPAEGNAAGAGAAAEDFAGVAVEDAGGPQSSPQSSSSSARAPAVGVAGTANARGFDADDFARSHPGGSLGRKLLTRVSDVMRSGDALPSVPLGALVPAAILEVTRKRMGMTAVVDPEGRVAGIFTDGDLRRLLERTTDIGGLRVEDVMTRTPASINAEALAVEAVRRMEERRIGQLLVLDSGRRMVGALSINDLLTARVV